MNKEPPRPLLPVIGTPLTVHRFLATHPDDWFTIDELSENCKLTENSIRTALTTVMLDFRMVRRKRPQENGRSIDEYRFLPFLKAR